MMDWNRLRRQWRQSADDGADVDVLAAVRQRDSRMRGLIVRRDRLETAVALVLAPIFAFAAWRAGLREAWLPMVFSAWLALWASYVPWHFWRVRRRLPQPRHELPLVGYLQLERDALRAQARMLEQVWIWYLAPCAIGVIGLVFSIKGPTTGSLVYAAIVLAFCAYLGRLNHHVARTELRDLAAQIDQQLGRLVEEDD